MKNYCQYYQANIKKEECWFFVGVLRSMESMAFDRTLDKASSLFEIYVPQENEPTFIELMRYFEQQGIASNVVKLPNRLMDPHQEL